MSSGFFVVLQLSTISVYRIHFAVMLASLAMENGCGLGGGELGLVAYIADSPLFDGEMCDTMDFNRSVILSNPCKFELEGG